MLYSKCEGRKTLHKLHQKGGGTNEDKIYNQNRELDTND